MNRAETQSAKRWLQRLPLLVTAVLIVLCAWVLAQLTWALLSTADTSIPTPNNMDNPVIVAEQNASSGVNLNLLISQPVFGRKIVAVAPKPKPKPVPVTTTVNETTLRNLTLVGVLASDNPDIARATIKQGNHKAETYKIEDTIVNDATLREVALDHIIILRNGKLEILRMKKATTATNSSRSSNNAVRSFNQPRQVQPNLAVNNNAPLGERLVTAREALLADPSKVSDYLRYRPQMKDGAVVGYRIYPGKDRALFRDAGLRSGDLVTSVNGIPISDSDQVMTILPQLQTATSATLTIVRRGQEQTINVSAP